MTVTASVTPAGLDLPGPGTIVLRDRKLNPGRRSTELSVFADDRWDLSPGLFEAHVPTSRLNFLSVPDPFRETVKHYVWQVINHDDPQPRSRTSRRPSLSSVTRVLPRLIAFLHWLDVRGIGRMADVTDKDLDRYAADVADRHDGQTQGRSARRGSTTVVLPHATA